MRTVTLRLDEKTLEKLDAWARALGKTRSELIREAIEHYLRRLEGREEEHRPKRRIKRVRVG